MHNIPPTVKAVGFLLIFFMKEGTSELMHALSVLAVFMFIVSFAASVFAAGNSYDEALVKKTHYKASSRYTLAYWDSENTLSPAEVYADIIQESDHVTIQINGRTLDADCLAKARSHDATGIRLLQETLTRREYKKVIEFDSTGNVILINYRSNISSTTHG